MGDGTVVVVVDVDDEVLDVVVDDVDVVDVVVVVVVAFTTPSPKSLT